MDSDVLKVFYTNYYSLEERMFDIIIDILGLVLDFLFLDLWSDSSKSMYKLRIDELRKQQWFDELYSDYRYSYIINNKRKVRAHISKHNNFKKLKKDQELQHQFTKMVKEASESIYFKIRLLR